MCFKLTRKADTDVGLESSNDGLTEKNWPYAFKLGVDWEFPDSSARLVSRIR